MGLNDPLCDNLRRLNIEVILLHPKSQGYLKLASRNPYQQPLIHPYGLSDEDDHDVETLAAGILEALKFAESAPLQKLNIKLEHSLIPECGKEHMDAKYWKCAVR